MADPTIPTEAVETGSLSVPRTDLTIQVPSDLGAAMIVHPPTPEERFQLRMAAADRPLWMPLVVLIPPGSFGIHGHLVDTLQMLSPAGATHLEWRKATVPSDEVIRMAINDREKPSATTMALWLAERLENHLLFPFIRTSMAAATLIFSHRTLHRRVRQLIGCRPSDLKRLAHLARLRRLYPTVEGLAAEARTTPTRLRERIKAGLQMTLKEFNQKPGWEWTLEAAVRAGLGKPGWGLGAGGWAKVTRPGTS